MRLPDRQTTWADGPTWRAWRVAPSGNPADACLASWLVDCPGAHPLWRYWIIIVVHLRELQGCPAPKKHYPKAAYEFDIVALNPDYEPSPDGKTPFHFLEPLDVVFQFDGLSDEEAARLPELAVKHILTGQISPDQDYRSVWEAILEKTVAHFKNGLGLS